MCVYIDRETVRQKERRCRTSVALGYCPWERYVSPLLPQLWVELYQFCPSTKMVQALPTKVDMPFKKIQTKQRQSKNVTSFWNVHFSCRSSFLFWWFKHVLHFELNKINREFRGIYYLSLQIQSGQIPIIFLIIKPFMKLQFCFPPFYCSMQFIDYCFNLFVMHFQWREHRVSWS